MGIDAELLAGVQIERSIGIRHDGLGGMARRDLVETLVLEALGELIGLVMTVDLVLAPLDRELALDEIAL